MMQQYLLVAPEEIPAARALGLPLGYLAARLGEEGRIHALSLPQGPLGGFLVVGAAQSPGGDAAPQRAAGDILALCDRHRFGGVMLDLETPPTPYLAALIRLLEGGLGRRALFLPEAYANYSGRAALCLSSALSGGSLRQRIQGALADYGPGRVVLAFQQAAEDFYLPAPQGKGRPLTQEELARRRRWLDPRVHFSPALCAHYFTYMSRENGAHLILFDDQASLGKKAALAQALGARRGLWVYAQVKEYCSAGWPFGD
jgi:hypothetical protein